VNSAEGVEAVVRALEPAKELAVDVEADAMHAFRARLCFVQLGTDEDVWLLDTLAPSVKAAPLAAFFQDPTRTKFFHAAGGDLQYLAEAGVRVKGLFDTHRAATLLGWPKVGLADLVLEKLGVKLAKEHQQSDFSLRPPPPGMRDYIADDVRYLCEVGRAVREACKAAGVDEEIELDCQRLADEAAERPDPLNDFKPKVNRSGMSPSSVAVAEKVARELHALRLKWAEAQDVPFGRVLSNAAVTAVSSKQPENLKDLARCEGVHGRLVREHGDEILALIAGWKKKAAEGQLPPAEAKAPVDRERKRREDQLTDWRKARAVERKITPSAVLPNPLVDELASKPPRSLEELRLVKYFGEKRVALYGKQLLELLAPR
jgi:ribonuclease D